MQARHDAQGGGSLEGVPELGIVSKWRQKERLKTTAVALVLCLNIGVDPPDVIKISPCARLECWVDPLSMQSPKAMETIGVLTLHILATLLSAGILKAFERPSPAVPLRFGVEGSSKTQSRTPPASHRPGNDVCRCALHGEMHFEAQLKRRQLQSHDVWLLCPPACFWLEGCLIRGVNVLSRKEPPGAV